MENTNKVIEKMLCDFKELNYELPTVVRQIALEQAGKLPNQTAGELLSNADKIEAWLLTQK